MKRLIFILILLFSSNLYAQWSGFNGVLRGSGTGESVDVIPTDGYYGLVTTTPGHVSTDNSTAATLTGDEMFTGAWEDITNYGVVVITVNSSHDSATNGLMVEFSSDGTNVDSDDTYTIPADTGKTFSFQSAAQYYRVKYTNGSTEQTSFRLQTILKPYYVKPSSHRIQDNIIDDDDAELGLSVLKLRTAQNVYVSGAATNSGNFKVSIEEFDTSVSIPLEAFTDNMDGETGLNVAAAMFGRADNDTLIPIKLDASTQDIQIVEHEHAEIHGGDHYEITSVVDLAINNVRDIRFTTADTAKLPHINFAIDVESETAWFLHESAIINTVGTEDTPYNNRRGSVNISGLSFDFIDNTSLSNANADTDISSGSELKCGIIGSGRKSLGTSASNKELILKQNTIYNLRLIATAAGFVNYDFEWYEHTDKN